jgi:hypothetical protein
MTPFRAQDANHLCRAIELAESRRENVVTTRSALSW